MPINLRFSVGGEVEPAPGAAHRRRPPRSSCPGPVDWVVVNDGAWGFYRVRYEATLLRRLTAAMHQQLRPLERLTPGQRHLGRGAGRPVAASATSSSWSGCLDDETDPDVWAARARPARPARPDRDRRGAAGPAGAGPPGRRAGLRPARLGSGGRRGRAGRDAAVPAASAPSALLGADPEVRAEAARRYAAYLEDRTVAGPRPGHGDGQRGGPGRRARRSTRPCSTSSGRPAPPRTRSATSTPWRHRGRRRCCAGPSTCA